MRRADLRSDQGFTLIELLAVISIGSIVVIALSAVLIVTFKTQDETAARLAASHDTQLVGTWLPVDAASAAISGFDTTPATVNPCGGASLGTNVLKLPYAKTSADSAQVANYRLEQDGETKDLVRYQCVTGGAPSRIVLANTLENTANAAVATLDCPGFPTCTGRLSISLLIHLSTGQTVTYDNNGRTGTTLAALAISTTTTGVTTTTTGATTTTTGSTTTTTLPCTISGSNNPSGVPNPVTTSGGKLDNAVVVTALTSGSCAGLTINYTPKNSAASPIAMIESPTGTWKATIPNDNTSWSTGPHTVTIQRGATTLGSFSLQVN
ncbi:MAG: hypothetical protein QOI95_279 [Acidimicrobiaceae bacterium]